MVEKVFISPNRVRAYGNIVNMKTGDDFTLVNSELTVTTDTVDGAEMTVFSMEVEPDISLTATNPYMLSGETTDVVVKLERGLGEPVTNKNVTLGQSIFRDDGTTASHNSNMQLYQGVRTITDTGTLLETDSNNRWDIRPNNFGLFDTPFHIEFDVVDTSNRLAIYLYNSNTAVIAQWDSGANLQSGDKIKVEVGDNNAKFYVNDVLRETINYTSTSKAKMRIFYPVANNYLKYKNFKVYEIINGVTDENGEFALHSVSVTDDTIFNATYGTVSATCLVEYCTFVDYAVKDKHNHNYFNQAGTSKVTITEADEYKEFKTISTTPGNIYIGSSTAATGFDVGDTWTIIWEKLYIDGYNVAFQCYNGSTTAGINSTTLGLHNSDFQELKFVCDGSSIKAYVDGVYKTQTSYTSTGHGYLRISLINNNGASQVTFRAKNIRIK